MKDVSQYPVTFPYGATTTPYSPVHPHLGEDRKTPIGTPDIVNGQTIGLSGNTGKSSGPHHHIQRVRNSVVVAPEGKGFNLPAPVVVVATGEQKDIGKFIRLRDGNNEIWSRFHLSEIKVTVGQKIGDSMNEKQANDMAYAIGLALMFSEAEINSRWHFNVSARAKTIKIDPYNYPTTLLLDKEVGYNSPHFQQMLWKAVHFDKEVAKAYEKGKAEAGNCTPEERAFLDLRKKI